MSQERLLSTSLNGKKVYIDESSKHALTHFDDVPLLESAVKEAVSHLLIKGSSLRIEYEMGYIIGNSDLVEIDSTDTVVYALRPHRDRYSKFVKNKVAEPTKWIVMGFEQRSDGDYSLYTAYTGRLTPSFPGGKILPEQSAEFWSKHALVWGTQEIIEGTETTECPW